MWLDGNIMPFSHLSVAFQSHFSWLNDKGLSCACKLKFAHSQEFDFGFFFLFYRYFTGHTCCIYLSGSFSSCTVPFSGCFSFFRVLFLSLKKYHGQRSSNGLGSEIHILRKSICFRQGYGCYDAIEVKLNLDIRELNGCRHL